MTGDDITDIDLIKNGVLWEEKTATAAKNPEKWVAKHINDKFIKYMNARRLLPGYRNAPIGFRFTGGPVNDDLKVLIEAEIQSLRSANPSVDIRVDFGD